MRFSGIVNATVRFGAVFKNRKCYGTAGCGFKKSGILRSGSVRFSDIVNITVRFGVVINPSAVRCGSPFNGFCYGAGPIPVGNKPYKPAGSWSFRTRYIWFTFYAKSREQQQ